MSEIRERAQWLVLSWGRPQSEFKEAITDLLAELERVEKIAEPIESGKVVAELTRLNQRIAELEANLKHVQGIAKATMDKLPERWNMGFQAGLKQAVPHEKDLTNALSDERKARKDDNAAFTEDILRLEAENNRLNTLLIESVTANDRLELFARQPRDGWTVWGNEVNSTESSNEK